MKNVLFDSISLELGEFRASLRKTRKGQSDFLPELCVLLHKMSKILSENSGNTLKSFLNLRCSFVGQAGENNNFLVGKLFSSIILYNEGYSIVEKNHGFFILISDWDKRMPIKFEEAIDILQDEMKDLSLKIFGEKKSFSFIKEVPPHPATERGQSNPNAYAFRLDMKLLM